MFKKTSFIPIKCELNIITLLHFMKNVLHIAKSYSHFEF